VSGNNLSLWQTWKQNLGSTRPWDLLTADAPRATDEQATERLAICNDCPFLTKVTQQCRKCGCFMHLKVKLAMADCPEGKWFAIADAGEETN
jgi:hypothetical protein